MEEGNKLPYFSIKNSRLCKCRSTERRNWKNKLTSTSRFSFNGNFLFCPRVFMQLCTALAPPSVSFISPVSPQYFFLSSSVFAQLLLAFLSSAAPSVISHGELITVSLLRARVIGVLLSALPFLGIFRAPGFVDREGVGLFSSSFLRG